MDMKNTANASPPVSNLAGATGVGGTVTDDEILDYVRDHWRDAWMGGGPGKGAVNDASIILFASSTRYETRLRIREEFARLISATEVRP